MIYRSGLSIEELYASMLKDYLCKLPLHCSESMLMASRDANTERCAKCESSDMFDCSEMIDVLDDPKLYSMRHEKGYSYKSHANIQINGVMV